MQWNIRNIVMIVIKHLGMNQILVFSHKELYTVKLIDQTIKIPFFFFLSKFVGNFSEFFPCHQKHGWKCLGIISVINMILRRQE